MKIIRAGIILVSVLIGSRDASAFQSSDFNKPLLTYLIERQEISFKDTAIVNFSDLVQVSKIDLSEKKCSEFEVYKFKATATHSVVHFCIYNSEKKKFFFLPDSTLVELFEGLSNFLKKEPCFMDPDIIKLYETVISAKKFEQKTRSKSGSKQR